MAKQLRQVAKRTKAQVASALWDLVLAQLQDLATGIQKLTEKGEALDAETRLPVKIECTVAELKKAASPQQWEEVEDFIAKWAKVPKEKPKA